MTVEKLPTFLRGCRDKSAVLWLTSSVIVSTMRGCYNPTSLTVTVSILVLHGMNFLTRQCRWWDATFNRFTVPNSLFSALVAILIFIHAVDKGFLMCVLQAGLWFLKHCYSSIPSPSKPLESWNSKLETCIAVANIIYCYKRNKIGTQVCYKLYNIKVK